VSEPQSIGETKLRRFFSSGSGLVVASVDKPFQALSDLIDSALARERARSIEGGVRDEDFGGLGVVVSSVRPNSVKPRSFRIF